MADVDNGNLQLSPSIPTQGAELPVLGKTLRDPLELLHRMPKFKAWGTYKGQKTVPQFVQEIEDALNRAASMGYMPIWSHMTDSPSAFYSTFTLDPNFINAISVQHEQWLAQQGGSGDETEAAKPPAAVSD